MMIFQAQCCRKSLNEVVSLYIKKKRIYQRLKNLKVFIFQLLLFALMIQLDEVFTRLNYANVFAEDQTLSSFSPLKSINSRVSFELEGVELISFLETYSSICQFSFFLDRRVDPSTLLTGAYVDVPFLSAFDNLLTGANLSVCAIGSSTLYVGPQNAAGEALLLSKMKRDGRNLEGMPRQEAALLFKSIDFTIAPYSEPRDVFKSFSQKTHLKLSGFDKTPFDLWRGANFKQISACNLLTILGLGFNVDFRYDQGLKALRPTFLDRKASITSYFPVSVVNSLEHGKYADCQIEEISINGRDQVAVSGSFENLAALELALSRAEIDAVEQNALKKSSGERRTRKKQDATRVQVSGKVDNATLKDIFAYLERNAGVVCSISPELEASGVTANVRVTCQFVNSDVSQVATIIARQIDATFKIDGTFVTFMPSNAP